MVSTPLWVAIEAGAAFAGLLLRRWANAGEKVPVAVNPLTRTHVKIIADKNLRMSSPDVSDEKNNFGETGITQQCAGRFTPAELPGSFV
jgi:hypothetical protein